MVIRILKPNTPGTRNRSVSLFNEITKNKPEKSLIVKNTHFYGRNNQGRITIRHRGGGHKKLYRLIDFKRNNYNILGKVASIEYDPNRNVRIALIKYEDGEKRYILYPQNLKINSIISSGINSKIQFRPSREQRDCLSNSHTISVLVKADQQIEKVPIWLIGDEERKFVEYPIFRKPGYDWGLSFNNSRAYTMQLWDRTKQHLYQWIKRYENQWSWITMAVDSENNKIHFYLNGRESDARLGTGTQSPLSYNEPLKRYGMEPFTIGYSKSPNEVFFKGGIASIQMWDRCLTSDEIKNLHKEMPEDNLVLDIFTMNLEFGEMENIELTKEKIEIPHTILPYRRDGKFLCLPHQTEGIIEVGGIQKWAKGETTAANERRYVLNMQQGSINHKTDGLSNAKERYQFISKEQIMDIPNAFMVNVKTIRK